MGYASASSKPKTVKEPEQVKEAPVDEKPVPANMKVTQEVENVMTWVMELLTSHKEWEAKKREFEDLMAKALGIPSEELYVQYMPDDMVLMEMDDADIDNVDTVLQQQQVSSGSKVQLKVIHKETSTSLTAAKAAADKKRDDVKSKLAAVTKKEATMGGIKIPPQAPKVKTEQKCRRSCLVSTVVQE